MPRFLAVFAQRKMAAMVALGFAAGLPPTLLDDLLSAWFKDSGVDIKTIALFGLVSLPWSLKFLWAPLFDRYAPPWLGRRRGWLLPIQLAMAGCIAALAGGDPAHAARWIAAVGLVIAFLGASQDILVDAYRADILVERESAAGSSLYVAGYRLGLIAMTTGGLALAEHVPWPVVFWSAAALVGLTSLATISSPEAPVVAGARTLREAVIDPFAAFIRGHGRGRTIAILVFVALYKMPDQLTWRMTLPFLQGLGYSKQAIGIARGTVAIPVAIVAGLIGGVIVARMGINRPLWVFGGLLAVSNLAYCLLAVVGQSLPLLYGAIAIEHACLGLVTAAFLGFLVTLCDKRYTATQFALLTSLMTLAGKLLSPLTGVIVDHLGWPGFFLIASLSSLPGLALLPWFAPWRDTREPAAAV